jgi:hypothetical protein
MEEKESYKSKNKLFFMLPLFTNTWHHWDPKRKPAKCIVYADDVDALGAVDLLGGIVREPPHLSSNP